jgi:hypothetical protein
MLLWGKMGAATDYQPVGGGMSTRWRIARSLRSLYGIRLIVGTIYHGTSGANEPFAIERAKRASYKPSARLHRLQRLNAQQLQAFADIPRRQVTE